MHNKIINKYRSILKKANNQNSLLTLERIQNAYEFINDYRNSDLNFYYDENINLLLSKINKKRFKLLKQKNKKKFRLGYILNRFHEVGGVSIPHKIMFEKKICLEENIEQYILYINSKNQDFNNSFLIKNPEYRYLKKNCPYERLDILNKNMNLLQKGKFIENWIHDNKIDFVIMSAHISSLYAVFSNPAPIIATYSPDWHTFTIGPGIGNINLLISTEQFFNYKFEKSKSYKTFIGLNLPDKKIIKSSNKTNLKNYGIYTNKKTILSITQNFWKCSLGESDFILKGISKLLEENPNYQHIFFGGKRNILDLDNFYFKNKKLKNRVHFIGSIKNVYSLYKSIDFLINSFPVSGSSNLEAAMCKKPSLNVIFNSRRLSGHGTEMLKAQNTEANNFEDFLDIGNKFIKSKNFRRDEGKIAYLNALKTQNKYIMNKKLINLFKKKYFKLSNNISKSYEYEIYNDQEYEKAFLYSKSLKKINKIKYLNKIILNYPSKIMPYLMLDFELKSQNKTNINPLQKIPNKLKNNLKFLLYEIILLLNKKTFSNSTESKIKKIINFTKYSELPLLLLYYFYHQNKDEIKLAKLEKKYKNINFNTINYRDKNFFFKNFFDYYL